MVIARYKFYVFVITYNLIVIRFEIIITTQNVDKEFLSKVNNDFNATEQTLDTTVATVHTRQMQHIGALANELYTRVSIDEPYRMDAKAYIERPFFVENLIFDINASRYSLLPVTRKLLPGDVIRSNQSLLNAMKIASYYRADLVLNVSMAGTITHAGCVLVGILPPTPTSAIAGSHSDLINTILSGPHGFLYANEATSIVLEVPWYCNSDMATLDMDRDPAYIPSLDITPVNGNYATLVMLVLNPLSPSTGSSTAISIVVEACFKALDIMVPTPRYVEWVAEGFVDNIKQLGSSLLNQTAGGLKRVTGDAIDSARQAIFGWTGLHNPNHATIQQRIVVTQRNFDNTVDSQQFFEKLDPYSNSERILEAPNFGTTVDEMRIRHIVSKKQHIGSFSVTASDTVGKLYWSRPISPYQGGISNISPVIVNNIELLHHVSRAWRGGLKLHIISVMNNKQQTKLRVLKMYNPSTKSVSAYPAYASIVNAPSDLLEFTQGGQEHIIDLPFLCRNDLCPCSRQLNFEALFHGLYYIYLAQPLINSDGSPMTVEFNIFLSGAEDLTFYGYATEVGKLPGFADFTTFAARDKVGMWTRSDVKKIDVGRQVREYKVEGNQMTLTKLSQQLGVSKKNIRSLNGLSPKDSEVIPDGTIVKYSVKLLPENRLHMMAPESLSLPDIPESISEWKTLTEGHPPKKKKKKFTCSCVCGMEVESVTVMNEPQVQKDTEMRQDNVVDFNHVDRLLPNIDVRPYIRRMYKFAGAQQLEVPASSAATFSFPLAGLLGEDVFVRDAANTPASIISSMYYGKNVGFKIKVNVITMDTVAGSVHNHLVAMRYLPPNMTYLIPSNTVTGNSYNTQVQPDALPLSQPLNGGVFPLPYQVSPVTGGETKHNQMFEFVIPDVTYYKFMGGPNKLSNSSNAGILPLSTQDFGNILVSITNPQNEILTIGLELFAGLTDETRMGFHSIAPKIVVPTYLNGPTLVISSLYAGETAGTTDPLLADRNVFIYKGGLL